LGVQAEIRKSKPRNKICGQVVGKFLNLRWIDILSLISNEVF
jgi:hypothetical protein